MVTASPSSAAPQKKPSFLSTNTAFVALIFLGGWGGLKLADYQSQHQEMSAHMYSTVYDQYSQLSEQGQRRIGALLDKGQLLQPELSAVAAIAVEDRGSIVVRSPDMGDTPESTLKQIYRFVMGLPTQSRAKDLLLAANLKFVEGHGCGTDR